VPAMQQGSRLMGRVASVACLQCSRVHGLWTGWPAWRACNAAGFTVDGQGGQRGVPAMQQGSRLMDRVASVACLQCSRVHG